MKNLITSAAANPNTPSSVKIKKKTTTPALPVTPINHPIHVINAVNANNPPNKPIAKPFTAIFPLLTFTDFSSLN